MLEEVGVGSDHDHRSDRAIGFDQGKVVSLRRSRVKDAEPVLPPSDVHIRLNLSVDDELVAACGIYQFSASVCGETELMVDKFQRKVGDTVVTRQLKRACAGVLMAWICRVINDVHAVH